MRKPPGYWMDIENVKRELQPLIKKFGRFPSNTEMIKYCGSSLPKYIIKYHGGIIKLSKLMNVPNYDESIGRKTMNSWNKDNVTEEFLEIINKRNLDYYPSRYDFKDWGYTIMTGITQTFKTYKNFKKHLKKLGHNILEKPNNIVWTSEKINSELTTIIDELGYFPTGSELDSKGLSTLRRIISENPKISEPFLKKVNRKLKKYTSQREKGYWFNDENLKRELIEIKSKFGRIPSSSELTKLGYGSISQHILKLNNKFLEELDYFTNSNLIVTKDGHRVRSSYELLFDNFLSYNKINHETEGIISNKIEKKFLYDFKITLDKQIIYVEIWGYSRGRTLREKNYVKKKQKKENIYKKLNLKLIGINEKVFSKPFDLMYLEFEKLIKKHVPSFSSIPINLDYFLWGSNYSKEDVIKELKPIVEKNNGFFPSTTQLKKIEGGEGLISMIQKFGGVDVFKNILKVDIRPNEVVFRLSKKRTF